MGVPGGDGSTVMGVVGEHCDSNDGHWDWDASRSGEVDAALDSALEARDEPGDEEEHEASENEEPCDEALEWFNSC